VVRRGNQVVYANERDDSGAWQSPPDTRQAIEAERARTWSAEETKDFAEKVDQLAGEMGPRWHAELDDITTRARGLANPQVALSDLNPAPEHTDGDRNPPSTELPSELTTDVDPDRNRDLGDDLEL
jgi:hypothetical protein